MSRTWGFLGGPEPEPDPEWADTLVGIVAILALVFTLWVSNK